MWQTIVVLLILLGVSLYLVRYFLRAYRTESPPCGACAGCCSHSPAGTRSAAQTAPISPPLTCQECNPHDHEASA